MSVTESVLCSGRGGCSFFSSRKRGFRLPVQCQTYSRYGHLAQMCFYRFNSDNGGPSEFTPVRFHSCHTGQINHLEGE